MKKRRSQLLGLVINGKTANTLGFTMARERRLIEGKAILEAAVEAARDRLRPILMTSFAFILGVAPLVVATGAGASARKSIGITVFSGMIASTCLAVVFVLSFFVVVQRFDENGVYSAGYLFSRFWIGSQSDPGGARSSLLARSRNRAEGGSVSAIRAKWTLAPAKSRARQQARPWA